MLNNSSESLEKLTHLRWVALNFPAGWTHWYLAQIPENFPTLQKYPCGLSWCCPVGCNCSALSDRVPNLELETEMWAYCRIWRKVGGRFYLWWPDTELNLMAIKSCSRQTWEWEFSQRLSPHSKGVLTRTCVLALFSLAGLVPESQTCFYIYQNFWSPLGTAILCQWNHVLLIPLSLLHCQLPALPADTLLRPAVERVASRPHLPLGSSRDQRLSPLLLFHYCPSDRPFQYCCHSSSPLVFFIFIWDYLLPATSSLLCRNNIFSFLSSSPYSSFLCCFSDSTSKLQGSYPLQPVL